MVFSSKIYNGLTFQIVSNLKMRKNRLTADVIAAGGRYNELIHFIRFFFVLSATILFKVLVMPSL